MNNKLSELMPKNLLQRIFFGIRKKLILFNSIVGIIFILALSLLLSQYMEYYTRQNINQYVFSLNSQISNRIDSYVEDMQKVLMILSKDSNLSVISDKSYIGTYEEYKAYTSFYNNVRSLLFFKGYKSMSVLLFDRQQILTTDLLGGPDFEYIKKAIGSNMYKEITDAKQSLILLPEFSIAPGLKEEDFFTQAIKIWGDIPGEKDFMVLSADKNLFSRFLTGVNNKAFDDILITTDEGKVIFSLNSKQLFYKGNLGNGINNLSSFDLNRIDGKDYYTTINNSKVTGWNVISLIGKDKIDQQIYKSQIAIVLIASSVIVIFIILVNIFVTSSTKDLKNLSRMMKNAEKDNYQSRSEIDRNDEIGELSRSFNLMVKNVLKNQVLRKEAEIKTLQEQINPHFLYNTLDTISSLAIKQDYEKINDSVERLADFYRYNINSSNTYMVDVGTEIQHVRNYLEIIKIRFGSRLEVEYEIDDGVLDFKAIRFMLQPVVENAIRHAFNERHSNYRVGIKAYFSHQTIVFEVLDNGSGIDKNRLSMILSYINGEGCTTFGKSSGGVGLRNVNLRIKLLFGDEYGIMMESNEGNGTRVIITNPKQG